MLPHVEYFHVFTSVYVNTHTQMCVYICTYVVCMWKPEVCIRCLCQLLSLLYIETRYLILIQSSLICPIQLSQLALGVLCLYLLTTGIIDGPLYPLSICVGQGIYTQYLTFMWEPLNPPRYLLSPSTSIVFFFPMQ